MSKKPARPATRVPSDPAAGPPIEDGAPLTGKDGTPAAGPEPAAGPRPEFDQYYPGGVMKQMADLAGVEIQYNQDVPGGVIEQLRVATTPDLELSQHGPGGPAGQIGYEIVGEPLPVDPSPPDPGEGTGEPPPTGTLPGPQPRSASVTAHDMITITFDAPLAVDLPYPEDFAVMADSTPCDVDLVGVGTEYVTLSMMEDIPTGYDVMAVSYTPSASAPLTGKDGTPVAAFSITVGEAA